MDLQFQVWLAPDSHKVQGLGDRNRKPVLRFLVWMFLKMTKVSSVKKRTESIVSQNGSPAKYLTRHKTWTETRAAERRAGLLPGAKGSACARAIRQISERKGQSLRGFFVLSSVPGKISGMVCVQ